MRENTLRVFWKDKFNGQAVTISAGDFNPALHRHQPDGSWPLDAEHEAEDGSIPADFPGAPQLTAVGYTTLAELRGLTADDLTQIKGIGKAKAAAILAALEE